MKTYEKLAIAALLFALMMTVLDVTLVNMALPVIAVQFDVSASESVWIVTIYQLVITVLLLPFSSVGDRCSYKKTFVTGVIVFTISSLLCSMADSFMAVVLSRTLQGVGAACVMSVNIALTRLIYPRQIIGRGLALNAMVIAVTTAIGPTLSGAILSFASWHWLFIINLPIGGIVLVLAMKYLPDNNRRGKSGKFDYVGAVQNIFSFGLIFIALNSFSRSGMTSVAVIMFVAGIGLGYFYIKRELHVQEPLFPVDLLKIRLYSLSLFTSVCSFIAQNLVLISLPFLFLKCFNFSEITTGLLLTPWPVSTMIVSPFAARLAERHNPGVIAALGMAVFSAGVASLIFYQPDVASQYNIALRLAICGVGYGLYQTPNNVVMVMSTPTVRAGAAGGLQSTARLVGQTLGAIIVGGVFAMSGDVLTGSVACLYYSVAIGVVAGVMSLCRTRDIHKKMAS